MLHQKNKTVSFQKKLTDHGLTKSELNAFNVCVQCGFCSRVDSLTATCMDPKDVGWIFMGYCGYINKPKRIDEKFKVNAWFCSLDCFRKQRMVWIKRFKDSAIKSRRTHRWSIRIPRKK